MEKLSKQDLLGKWKCSRDKMLTELNFCVKHNFNLESELIRKKLELLEKLIFDLEYVLQ